MSEEVKYIEIVTWNRKMILLHGDKLTRTQKAIGLRSNGLHVELRFSDRYGRISFSCTLADGCGCCRFKMIDYSHPYRQSRVRIAVTAEQELGLFITAVEMADARYFRKYPFDEALDIYFNENVAKNGCIYGPDAIKYDKYGASFAFISKLNWWRMHPEDMICNEAVANVMLAEWPDLLDIKYVLESFTGGICHPSKRTDPATLTPDIFEYLVRHYFYTLGPTQADIDNIISEVNKD